MIIEKKNKKMKAQTSLLGILIVLALISVVSARPLTCADNPVALWHFNEGSGNSITDTCSGIVGTLHGTNTTWINGKYGKSILFNGFDNYISIGGMNQSFENFSIMTWVKALQPNADYQTFVGREIFTAGTWFWNFALAKDSINQGYPESSYFNLFDDLSLTQNVQGTYFSPPQYNTITDGTWHLLVGTFDGANQNMTLYYDGNLIGSSATTITNISSSTGYFLMGADFNSDISNYAYFLNGSLDDVAIFNRVLTQNEITDYYSPIPTNYTCYNNANAQLSVPSYPYVDSSSVYTINYQAIANNTPVYVGDVFADVGNIVFNLTWDYNADAYSLSLFFNTIGDYPFTIYSGSPCQIENTTGTFLVRTPYFVTIQGFKDTLSTPYINNFAYVIAEPKNKSKSYNQILQQYITPIGFASTFKSNVFSVPYRNGQATLKLYEPTDYAIRLVDGNIRFANDYSVPNISSVYTTNAYLGLFSFNGTNMTEKVLLQQQDLHPYRYLTNWGLLIGLILAVVGAVVLFFVFPEHPLISVGFGIGFIIILVLFRLILWLWWNM